MKEPIDFIHEFKPSVLLVEDDALTQKIEAYIFRELGCEIDTAVDVKAALQILSKPYDLIVLDVGLPDQSGLHLTEDIRRGRTSQHANTPILIVSMYTEETDKQRYLTAGANAVFSKPMNPEHIKKLLHSIVENPTLY